MTKCAKRLWKPPKFMIFSYTYAIIICRLTQNCFAILPQHLCFAQMLWGGVSHPKKSSSQLVRFFRMAHAYNKNGSVAGGSNRAIEGDIMNLPPCFTNTISAYQGKNKSHYNIFHIHIFYTILCKFYTCGGGLPPSK